MQKVLTMRSETKAGILKQGSTHAQVIETYICLLLNDKNLCLSFDLGISIVSEYEPYNNFVNLEPASCELEVTIILKPY